MRRLFASSISCIYEGPAGWAMANVNVADRAELWWDSKQPARPLGLYGHARERFF
jgi:hypothetical protein